MLSIAQKLGQLSSLYAQQAKLETQKNELIAQILPPELRARLDEIEEEFSQKADAAFKAIDALETEIKSETLAFGNTVKASGFLAVWNRGRVSWDSKGLAVYAEVHPEVLEFRKEGEPSVIIRRVQEKELG